MQNKVKLLLLLVSLLFSQICTLTAEAKGKDDKLLMQRINVLNMGVLEYPSAIEERSDIPFKLLVDEEYQKMLGDTVDYEKFRPALIFFEKGFQAPVSGQKRVQFPYITVTVMSGTYRFPKELSQVQKETLENNIRQDVQANLEGTGFTIKKWEPFAFNRINGLFSIAYSYEQVLNGKDVTNNISTYLYDSDVQLQITLSAPKKEYKKWLTYYNSMVPTFARSINISDIATLYYPTTVAERKDVPFKYLVDDEFKKILGDSIDYEKFRPGLLFLDRNFEITDTTKVDPFGNISINVVPEFYDRVLDKDSLKIDVLKERIKANVQSNIDSTAYKITRWGDFTVDEIKGLPMLRYSYQQKMEGKEANDIRAAYIFDKTMQVQMTVSAPEGVAAKWNDIYDTILGSYERLQAIPGRGTIVYPAGLEERSDIPFVKLVDNESKKKLGDSIDYEKFRPTRLFLKKSFNENDPLQLADFGSITITDRNGDFTRLNDSDSVSSDVIEKEFRASVERNLLSTNYKLVNWDSFEIEQKNGCRHISYSYTQQIDGAEPKHIATTHIFTNNSQTTIVLTCSDSEYSFWKPEYDSMVDSFRLIGWR